MSIAILATSLISSATFAAGCTTPENRDQAKTPVSVEKLKEELKTPREWLAVMKAEAKAAYAQNPDLYEIETGAALVYNNANAGGNYYNKSTTGTASHFVFDKDLPIELVRSVNKFEKFMKVKGDELLKKWNEDGKLEKKDYHFTYIIQFIAGGDKRVGGQHTVTPELKRLLGKGYEKIKFTRSDMDKLRSERSRLSRQHQGSATSILRGILLEKGIFEGQLNNYNIESKTHPELFRKYFYKKPGEKIRDFKALKFETALKALDYTDHIDFAMPAHLRPGGVEYIVSLFESAEVKENGEVIVNMFQGTEGHSPDEYVQLSKLYKEKPVLMMSFCVNDVWLLWGINIRATSLLCG